MVNNGHNIVAAGHAKLRKQAEDERQLKMTLAKRKAQGPSDKVKLKRAIRKEIKRLENMLEDLEK